MARDRVTAASPSPHHPAADAYRSPLVAARMWPSPSRRVEACSSAAVSRSAWARVVCHPRPVVVASACQWTAEAPSRLVEVMSLWVVAPLPSAEVVRLPLGVAVQLPLALADWSPSGAAAPWEAVGAVLWVAAGAHRLPSLLARAPMPGDK